MDRLKQIILDIHPEANVHDLTDALLSGDVHKVVKQIKRLTKYDHNAFVIIANRQLSKFKKILRILGFHDIHQTYDHDAAFILRYKFTGVVSLCDTEYVKEAIKMHFAPNHTECTLCCEVFDDDDIRRSCYWCNNPICKQCILKCIRNTVFWCPFCNNHFIWPQLQRPYDVDPDKLETINNTLRYHQMCVLTSHPEQTLTGCFDMCNHMLHALREAGVVINERNDTHHTIMRSRSNAIALTENLPS